MDYLLLNLYLGAVCFLIGTIVFSRMIKKKRSKRKIILLVVLQFVSSLLGSLIIWRFWPFDFDIMVAFISLPATIAEIITILIYTRILDNNKSID